MGLGRRDFLMLTSLALAGKVIDPLKAVAINNNYYVNKKFGIILEKPEDWVFVSVKDFGRLLDEQILPNEIEFQKKELFEELGEPIFVITKYGINDPYYKDKFSPTISTFINHKSELEDIEYESFEELIKLSSLGTSILLREFVEISIEGPLYISGCKSYLKKATYLFEHVDLVLPVRTNLQVLMIEHNNYYYFINMHDSDEVNENSQGEYETFIKTIKLI